MKHDPATQDELLKWFDKHIERSRDRARRYARAGDDRQVLVWGLKARVLAEARAHVRRVLESEAA